MMISVALAEPMMVDLMDTVAAGVPLPRWGLVDEEPPLIDSCAAVGESLVSRLLVMDVAQLLKQTSVENPHSAFSPLKYSQLFEWLERAPNVATAEIDRGLGMMPALGPADYVKRWGGARVARNRWRMVHRLAALSAIVSVASGGRAKSAGLTIDNVTEEIFRATFSDAVGSAAVCRQRSSRSLEEFRRWWSATTAAITSVFRENRGQLLLSRADRLPGVELNPSVFLRHSSRVMRISAPPAIGLVAQKNIQLALCIGQRNQAFELMESLSGTIVGCLRQLLHAFPHTPGPIEISPAVVEPLDKLLAQVRTWGGPAKIDGPLAGIARNKNEGESIDCNLAPQLLEEIGGLLTFLRNRGLKPDWPRSPMVEDLFSFRQIGFSRRWARRARLYKL